MTTLRKALLQQALEALRGYRREIGDEQPCDAERALEAALEQPEQEPVEIKPPPNPEGAAHCIMRWMAETPAGWVGAWDRAALAQFVTQPRREWQVLTEDEIDSLWRKWVGTQRPNYSFTRAIESKLKELNHE